MKRGRRKGGSKEKVFGCDLMEHLSATNQEVPQVLRSCGDFIEVHGITDGIYRLSGVSSNTLKLRSEFDSEGNPDLSKDVYLQDIHCVSSLCKAYFRELPNPLLTYQLYDRFAEAVAVQLENERLIKIKEVLKELPRPHYRTLEYLMRHLLRMSTYSSETNMHIRNLAIVWAPNLLRSKDIEASGFNGTAAFMEVRVQSIVVEFILNHVAQLFPETDPECGSSERRKSLPSPSLLQGAEENYFKAVPFQYPGNMSPGDGPLSMRPYHAIIDGTDKRKGSLKGRKWKSIFNLGGRLHDPRKKNKYAPKDKEKNALRPAKSMDSLSSGPYTQEETQGPSMHLSPLVAPTANTESVSSGLSSGSSGYAVTYRRTGGASVSVVSGGNGAQGTYRSLDPGATANADKNQASQGMPSRAERRAGMHITVPYSVTVPLHITSGLVQKVMERSEESEEEQLKKVKKESSEEKESEEEQENGKTETLCDNEKENTDIISKTEEKKEVEKEETVAAEPEETKGSEDECTEVLHLSVEEDSDKTPQSPEPPVRPDEGEGGYMVMRPVVLLCPTEPVGQQLTPPPPPPPQPQEAEYPDQDLLLDFQDTFGFLDLIDTSASNQVVEFSVEPPAFEMEEEEDEEETQSPSLTLSACSSPNHFAEEEPKLNLATNLHRLVPGKSHSLPYKSSAFQPALSPSSDEEDLFGPDEGDDDSESEKSEYEDMFYKSLPSANQFQGLNWSCPPSFSFSTPDKTECLNQTPVTTEPPEDISELPPGDTHEILGNQLHSEITADDQAGDRAIDGHLNKVDISPLPENTELLNIDHPEDQMTVDDSTEDGHETGSNKDGNVNKSYEEQTKMEESLDGKEEAETSSQEEIISMQCEIPEVTSLVSMEPSSSETPCMTDLPPYIEEHAHLDVQTESPESNINASNSNVAEIDATDSVLEETQDFDGLSSLFEVHTEICSDSDAALAETGEEECTESEAAEELIDERSESELCEGEENDALMQESNVNKVEIETDVVAQEVETCAERKEEDGEEITDEKQMDDRGAEEESDREMKKEPFTEEMEVENETAGDQEMKEEFIIETMTEEKRSVKEDESLESDEVQLEEKEHEAHPEEPGSSRRNENGPGMGRVIIKSKNTPGVYLVKAVPVVPPKPQHAKITAFKQQFQQKDPEKHPASLQHSEKGLPTNENEHNGAETADAPQNHNHQSAEQGDEAYGEEPEDNQADHGIKTHLKNTKTSQSFGGEEKKEIDDQKQRRGTWDGASLGKEHKRTSGISICFDEAVARATGKRCKEKESVEKDRFIDLHWERAEQKEGLNQMKKEEEERN